LRGLLGLGEGAEFGEVAKDIQRLPECPGRAGVVTGVPPGVAA
jgi:hypothetical protein